MVLLNILLMIISVLVLSFVDIKHALHIFQQNRYELFRLKGWVKAQKKDWETVVLFVIKNLLWIAVLVLCLILPLSQTMITLFLTVLALVCGYIKYKKEKGKSYIKPLHVTARVQRQMATIAVLYVLITLLFCIFVPAKFWAVLMIVMPLFSWACIWCMFYINEPIEKAVREHFLNEARTIIANSPSLVKIGITGSYGKTSTKNIVQAVLSDQYYSLMTPASFNTPMGITITIREHLKPLHEVFVCEMGADKVGEIDYLTKFVKPTIGIVTSIGPQHLNTFGSLENIITEKMLMVENLPKDGVGILNYDNKYIREYKIKNSCRTVTCGIESEDVDYRAVDIEYQATGSTFNILHEGRKYPFSTKLLGAHNILNIVISVAVGREMNVSFENLQKAVMNIEKIEHRLELKKINGFTFIDNAFNSNPEGSAMSLEVLSRMPETRWIVTPGMIDLGEKQYSANKHFGELMKGRCDQVILVGPKQTEPIYDGLKESGFDMECVHVVEKVAEAFAYVYKNADPKDTILLENDLPDAFNK